MFDASALPSHRPSAPRHLYVSGSDDDDDNNAPSSTANVGRRLIGHAASATATTVASSYHNCHLQLPASTNLPAMLTDTTAPSDAHHAGSPAHYLLLPADDVPLDPASATTPDHLSHRLSRLRHHASSSPCSDHAVIADHAAAHVDDNINEHCTSHHDGPYRTSGHVIATTTTTRGNEPEFDIGL